ncbi:MAG TPA: hypothetical protein VIK29_07160 [Paludibacter sp.]
MTAEEFFPLLKIPIYWKYMGSNDVPNSIGYVFDDKTTQTIYRVFYNIDSERGGITERKRLDNGKPKYKCLTANKTSSELNEYFLQNY